MLSAEIMTITCMTNLYAYIGMEFTRNVLYIHRCS